MASTNQREDEACGANPLASASALIDSGVERQLEACRAAVAIGNVLALIDAVKICITHRSELRDWMVEPLLDCMVQHVSGKARRRRGRGARPMAKAKTAYIDQIRWSTVQDALADLDPFKLQTAFEEAHDRLRGTLAKGSTKTIERSYQLIERALRESGFHGKAYMPRRDTLEDLGIKLPEG